MEELWDGVSHYSEEKGWPMLGRMKIDILNSLIVATASLSSVFQARRPLYPLFRTLPSAQCGQ